MADKFVLGLAEMIPAFYTSSKIMDQPQQMDQKMTNTETFLQHGLFGLLQKNIQKQDSGIQESPPDQIIDIRDQDREYSDVIHLDDNDNEQQQQQQQQNVAVGNDDDDDDPNQRDFQQQVDHNRDPNVVRLIESFSRLDFQTLDHILNSVIGIYHMFDHKIQIDEAGNTIPKKLTDDQKNQLKEYEKDLQPVRQGCRRFIFFDKSGKINEMTICQDGEVKLPN